VVDHLFLRAGLSCCLLNWLKHHLVREVLRFCMVWEIFRIFRLKLAVDFLESRIQGLGEQTHVSGPDDSHAHEFPRIGYDCTRQ